jgi:hypothetical protein
MSTTDRPRKSNHIHLLAVCRPISSNSVNYKAYIHWRLENQSILAKLQTGKDRWETAVLSKFLIHSYLIFQCFLILFSIVDLPNEAPTRAKPTAIIRRALTGEAQAKIAKAIEFLVFFKERGIPVISFQQDVTNGYIGHVIKHTLKASFRDIINCFLTHVSETPSNDTKRKQLVDIFLPQQEVTNQGIVDHFLRPSNEQAADYRPEAEHEVPLEIHAINEASSINSLDSSGNSGPEHAVKVVNMILTNENDRSSMVEFIRLDATHISPKLVMSLIESLLERHFDYIFPDFMHCLSSMEVANMRELGFYFTSNNTSSDESSAGNIVGMYPDPDLFWNRSNAVVEEEAVKPSAKRAKTTDK